jgi:hypothetical protein
MQDPNKLPVFCPTLGRPGKNSEILDVPRDEKGRFVFIYVLEADDDLPKYLKRWFQTKVSSNECLPIVYLLPSVHAGAGHTRRCIQTFAEKYLPEHEWIFMVDDSVGHVYTKPKNGNKNCDQVPLLTGLEQLHSRAIEFVQQSGQAPVAAVGMQKSRSADPACVDFYFPQFCYPSSLILLNMHVCKANDLYFDSDHRVAEDICFSMRCLYKNVLTLVDKHLAHLKKRFTSGGAADDRFVATKALSMNELVDEEISVTFDTPINDIPDSSLSLTDEQVLRLFPDAFTTISRKNAMYSRLDSKLHYSWRDGMCLAPMTEVTNPNDLGYSFTRNGQDVNLLSRNYSERAFTQLASKKHHLVAVNQIDANSALLVSNCGEQRIVDVRCPSHPASDVTYSVKDSAFEDAIMVSDREYLVLRTSGEVKCFDLRKSCDLRPNNITAIEQHCKQHGATTTVRCPVIHKIHNRKTDQPCMMVSFLNKDKTTYGAVLMDLNSKETLTTDYAFKFDHRPVPVLDKDGNIGLFSAPANAFCSRQNAQHWSQIDPDSIFEFDAAQRFFHQNDIVRWSPFGTNSFLTCSQHENVYSPHAYGNIIVSID